VPATSCCCFGAAAAVEQASRQRLGSRGTGRIASDRSALDVARLLMSLRAARSQGAVERAS
jgi:hypothetical protein